MCQKFKELFIYFLLQTNIVLVVGALSLSLVAAVEKEGDNPLDWLR